MKPSQHAALLRQAFERRVLVFDGAMGTMIQSRNLSAEDFGGPQYEGCNEYLNLVRPDVIRDIHDGYLDAGADLISSNSFGCAPYVLGEYGLATEPRITLPRPPGRAADDGRSTAARRRFARRMAWHPRSPHRQRHVRRGREGTTSGRALIEGGWSHSARDPTDTQRQRRPSPSQGLDESGSSCR